MIKSKNQPHPITSFFSEHSILLTMQNQPRQKMAMEVVAPGTTREVQNWKRQPVSELIKIILNNIHKLFVYLVYL